uniref:Uncharacterized protein n=1 Tax=Ditylenchus dipsaci TaxID=166011 RepID=A0A915EHI2_9BILA
MFARVDPEDPKIQCFNSILVMISALHHINCWTAFVFGVSLNSLLLWLIWKRSSKEMKVYRAILQQACLIDYWLIVTNVSIQLIFVTFDGHNIFLCIGLLSWLKYPYSSYYVGMLLVCAFFHLFYYSGLVWSAFPDENKRQQLNSTALFDHFQLEGSFFSPDNIFMLVKADSGKWAITCGYLMLLQFLAYSIVITCGIKIKRYVKNSNIGEPGSKRMDQVNKELSIILFFQTVLPLAEFSLSAVCIFTSIFFADSSSISLFSTYLVLPIHWMPVINPLITISVVKTYRNFIRPSKKVVSTTTTNSVTDKMSEFLK